MRYGGSLRFLLGPLLLLPLRFPLPRVLQPYTSISERLLSRGLAVVYRQVPAGARGETRARAARHASFCYPVLNNSVKPTGIGLRNLVRFERSMYNETMSMISAERRW